MYLDELFAYKNQLMKDLLTNPKIVSLINDKIDFENADQLAYTQVFPYEYIPDTAQEGMTYVCFDVDVTKADNKSFLEPVIYVWVFSHRHALRLPEGGVRPDQICTEICKALNGSRMYGLGQLNFYSLRRFSPMTDYLGKAMTFYATEVNRQWQYDSAKPIPSNRRPVKFGDN